MIQDQRYSLPAFQGMFNEEYWLKRARLTRSKAATVNDPKLQHRLLRVASEYERLAGRARASEPPTYVSGPARARSSIGLRDGGRLQ